MQALPRLLLLCLALVFTAPVALVIAVPPAQAQLLGVGGSEEQTKPAPTDPFNRTTPRGTVQGYIDAMAAKDPDRAARYLDSNENEFRKRILANQLRLLLDRNGKLLPTVEIDHTPNGNLNDGLDADVDRVGTLGSGDNTVPLLLTRKKVDGVDVWLFAPQSLDAVQKLLRSSKVSLVEQYVPEYLSDYYLFGVTAGNWLAVVVLFAVSLLTGYLVALIISWVASTLWMRTGHDRSAADLRRARWPLGLLLSNIWFKAGAVSVGISVIAREYAFRLIDIGSVIALVWLIFVITRAVSHAVLRQMSRRAQTSAISAAKLLTRIINAVAVLIGAVLVLDILGFDVTTGLAALGIGGIALALGAQKTIENLVGSVMLVVDQPIRVGDFCQFEGALGTVEDIGIRSTRVRTLERTLVTIPNGSFSSMQIENYTLREKYLFRHKLGARYETNAKAIRAVKKAIFDYLAEHPNIEGEEPGVRFIELGSDNLTLEVFAYVLAPDVPAFFEIQSELLLGLMEVFEKKGVDFAFPSQTVYLARDNAVPIAPEPGKGSA
jgi:MscS family membrane protein